MAAPKSFYHAADHLAGAPAFNLAILVAVILALAAGAGVAWRLGMFRPVRQGE